ncbi:acyl carrier protein [Kitasatospora sp. NPDC092948]|uniref:acyl carrier protein n=1 Tax=Kitasatospora sp. NPDC092948 TaxID=3364088 RepID=UPI003800C858
MTDPATDSSAVDPSVVDLSVADPSAIDPSALGEEPGSGDVDPELRGRALDGILLLLPRVLKRELPEVTENACLFDEVGLTSAATLELILELEDHLDVQIDVEGIDQDDLRSVGTLAGFVAGHVIAED